MKFFTSLMILFTIPMVFSQKGKYVVEYDEMNFKKADGYIWKKQKHGPWKHWNRSGQLIKEENYVQGELTGKYVDYHFMGLKKSEGEMLKGQLNGGWKYWNMEGELEKEVTYVNGELNGRYALFKTVIYFKGNDSDRYEYYIRNYEYFKNLQDGNKAKDTLERGFYKNGIRDSICAFFKGRYLNDKEIYTLKNEIKSGPAWEYAGTTLISRSTYLNDVKHGPCTTYFYNGRIKKLENYQNGLKAGHFVEYHYSNQRYKEENFTNDLKNGSFITYTEDGKIIHLSNYVNDTLHGAYYDSTEKYYNYRNDYVIKASYHMGQFHGPYLQYNQKNTSRLIGSYQFGKKEGRWYEYGESYDEMHTYKNDSLLGPYWEHDKSTDSEQIVYKLEGFDDISADTSGFTGITSTKTYGEYLTPELNTVNIYSQDSVRIASFALNDWGSPTGKYTIYKKGKLFFKGYFKDGREDSTWTYYDAYGKITEMRKYRLQKYSYDDYEHEYSVLVYVKKIYPNGTTEFIFDDNKNEKRIYWPNGNLHALYWLNTTLPGGLGAREKIFDQQGQLCIYREYGMEGDLFEEKKYCNSSDTISIRTDQHASKFIFDLAVPVAIEDEVYVFSEQQPEFPGGEASLYEYINLRFDEYKMPAGIIRIQFIVQKFGEVEEVRIISDNIGNGAGVVLAKVILQGPRWNPGELNGRDVRTLMEIELNNHNSRMDIELKIIDKDVDEEN